mgnify:CR=1 FL=1
MTHLAIVSAMPVFCIASPTGMVAAMRRRTELSSERIASRTRRHFDSNIAAAPPIARTRQEGASGAARPAARDDAVAANKEVTKVFTEKGVKVHVMTKEEWQAWEKVAKDTAWKAFAQAVPAGKELLDLASK